MSGSVPPRTSPTSPATPRMDTKMQVHFKSMRASLPFLPCGAKGACPAESVGQGSLPDRSCRGTERAPGESGVRAETQDRRTRVVRLSRATHSDARFEDHVRGG